MTIAISPATTRVPSGPTLHVYVRYLADPLGGAMPYGYPTSRRPAAIGCRPAGGRRGCSRRS